MGVLHHSAAPEHRRPFSGENLRRGPRDFNVRLGGRIVDRGPRARRWHLSSRGCGWDGDCYASSCRNVGVCPATVAAEIRKRAPSLDLSAGSSTTSVLSGVTTHLKVLLTTHDIRRIRNRELQKQDILLRHLTLACVAAASRSPETLWGSW